MPRKPRGRFVVESLTGYSEKAFMNSRARELTDWYVYDRAYNYRIVAEYPATRYGRMSSFRREILARARAQVLNDLSTAAHGAYLG